jgi:hypothetical protein
LGEGQRGTHGAAAREEAAVPPAQWGREEGEGGVAWWAGSTCLSTRGQKGWMGWLATGSIGPKVEEKFFSDKNWNFEYTKALEICTRRFGRNLDTRIFPKFF